MNVMIPEITDKELTELLRSCGMTADDARCFIEQCGSSCCAEKLRVLRKTRRSLLDNIHEKQAVLDKLDNLIWCMEHGGRL